MDGVGVPAMSSGTYWRLDGGLAVEKGLPDGELCGVHGGQVDVERVMKARKQREKREAGGGEGGKPRARRAKATMCFCDGI